MKYFIVILILCLSGCDFLEFEEVDVKPETYYELKRLPKLMMLRRKPINVKWDKPIPDKYGRSHLIALMQFTQEDYDYILRKSRQYDIIEDSEFPANFFYKWVDKSIADKMTLIKKKGDQYVPEGYIITQGYVRVEANMFVRRSMPWNSGRVYPLADNYMLVDLYAQGW